MQFRTSGVEIKNYFVVYFEGITAELQSVKDGDHTCLVDASDIYAKCA